MNEKYALVTGATGGLGNAFSIECAKRGYNLVITDLSEEKLETLSNKLQSVYGIAIVFYPCDLRDDQERNSFFEWIDRQEFELFLTINVAGLDYEGKIESLSSQNITTVIRVNTEATLDITRYICAKKHCGDFYIINVASMAGFYCMPLKALYAASKRAIIQFSLAIREEIRRKNGHITVLCPAGLRTTPITIAKIDSQGFVGKITTVDYFVIAEKTIDKVFQNKAIFVPGIVNKIIVGFSKIVPDTIKAKLIYRRWSMTQEREQKI